MKKLTNSICSQKKEVLLNVRWPRKPWLACWSKIALWSLMCSVPQFFPSFGVWLFQWWYRTMSNDIQPDNGKGSMTAIHGYSCPRNLETISHKSVWDTYFASLIQLCGPSIYINMYIVGWYCYISLSSRSRWLTPWGDVQFMVAHWVPEWYPGSYKFCTNVIYSLIAPVR